MKKYIILLLLVLGVGSEAFASLEVRNLRGGNRQGKNHDVLNVPAIQSRGAAGGIQISADVIRDPNALRIVSVVVVGVNGQIEDEKLMSCLPAPKGYLTQANWILPGKGYKFKEYIVDRPSRGRHGHGPLLARDARHPFDHIAQKPCAVENAKRLLARLKRNNVLEDSHVYVRGVIPVKKLLAQE